MSFRPFVVDDQPGLEEICGTDDYLPHIARQLLEDPHSRFVVVVEAENEQETNSPDEVNTATSSTTVLAVANARRIHSNVIWLEAIRTSANHRNQGLATKLLQHLLTKDNYNKGTASGLQNNTETADSSQQQHEPGPSRLRFAGCTAASNAPMIRVLQRVSLTAKHFLHILQFSELRKLSGWSAADTATEAKPLLQALELEHFVSDIAKRAVLVPIESMADLGRVLRQLQEQHRGMGYMPGLYELLSVTQLDQCLIHGRLWKTQAGTAVMALSQDHKIQSLRSKWVCSVAAGSAADVEAALWFACHRPEAVPFTLSVDGCVDLSESTLLTTLPFHDDKCLLFQST
jgi:hypothetical protein